MKLMVGTGVKERGFALPTILLVSTVMLIVLVASIAATAASRVSLDSQYYNLLAKQAAQSGIARATECLAASGYKPQWSTLSVNRDLRPNSTCTGSTLSGSGVSPYVVGDGVGPSLNIRTKYSIEAPANSGVGSILQVVGTTELIRTVAPYNVWRSYTQSLYHRIEAPQAIACTDGFVAVPGDSRFGTSDFCVGKYEVKSVGGKAVSQASGTLLVNISQSEAISAASNACNGCRLISEAEWLTIAHNLINVASNWTGESVGSGTIYRGHSDNNPSNPLAASTNDDDGYFGTNNASGTQRRTLTLSNGGVIWDFSGNLWEWTNATITGNQPGDSSWVWREWQSVPNPGYSASPTAPLWSPFPSFATSSAASWTFANGMGRLYSNSSYGSQRAFLRSGNWSDSNGYGVFSLALNRGPDQPGSDAGFRLTK